MRDSNPLSFDKPASNPNWGGKYSSPIVAYANRA